MPPPAPGCSLARPPPIQIVPPRTRRPSTASGKVRYVHEVGELGDDIDNFERMRGLTMAAEGLPEWDTDVVTTRKSWAERKDQVEHELRMEALAERFKSGAHRPTRGSQHDLDPCHRRPVPVRPASAAPRPLGLPVTDTARTDALLQSYIDMHKESAEQHNMALQEALLEKIRVHKERTQTRRNAQRSTMQLRREASRDFAVQLQHPFFVKQARAPRAWDGPCRDLRFPPPPHPPHRAPPVVHTQCNPSDNKCHASIREVSAVHGAQDGVRRPHGACARPCTPRLAWGEPCGTHDGRDRLRAPRTLATHACHARTPRSPG